MGKRFSANSIQAVFYGFNLAAIPSDKDYQLWMLKGNQPISAGVFTPDADGNAISEFTTIPDDENISAFAVTLEPKGGVSQPTGEMYLIGAL
ncbi:anti-sigma factor [candidate division KSB1 bacterium]|nr:anti-sigma factor [candidate division KSB1 bacterium]